MPEQIMRLAIKLTEHQLLAASTFLDVYMDENSEHPDLDIYLEGLEALRDELHNHLSKYIQKDTSKVKEKPLPKLKA